MPDNELSNSLVTVSESTSSSLMSSLIVSILMNIFLKGAIHILVKMINNLQLIVHIPMLNVIIPANVITMFAILIPLVMFDMLEDLKLLDIYFPDSEQDADVHMRDYDQLRDIGY